MEISVRGFNAGERIPDRYTCKGMDIQPVIEFRGVPKETKSIILIMDDPDAPTGTFTHWLAYNIPPDSVTLDHSRHSEVSFGINDFGNEGYNGPCPPKGKPHRYYFRAYATTLSMLPKGLHRKPLDDKLKSTVIGYCDFMGVYSNEM